jgi:hypothetical protein
MVTNALNAGIARRCLRLVIGRGERAMLLLEELVPVVKTRTGDVPVTPLRLQIERAGKGELLA